MNRSEINVSLLLEFKHTAIISEIVTSSCLGNSLIILVAWEIWKHHNDSVSNGADPSVIEVSRAVSTEARFWFLARALALQDFLCR